jgi:hypothetical protein
MDKATEANVSWHGIAETRAHIGSFCLPKLIVAKVAVAVQIGGSARGYRAGLASLAARS